MDDIRAYSYQNEERLMFGALFLCNLCSYLEFKTGLEISGGVAKNKLLAKVGCGKNKPKKITIFFEEATHRVFQDVKISNIPGLGVRFTIIKLHAKINV
jgi:DNA polymerase eta